MALSITLILFAALWIEGLMSQQPPRPEYKRHWYANQSTDVGNSRTPTASHGVWLANTAYHQSTTTQCPISPEKSSTYSVIVGGSDGLNFVPNELDVNVGDTVIFNFLGQNHTLTQSSLAHPCTSDSGFSTGFKQFNPKNVNGKFIIEYFVNIADPQWFYCAQTSPLSHCIAGMVFALNAGSSMSTFISNAVAQPPTNMDSTLKVTPTAPNTPNAPSTTPIHLSINSSVSGISSGAPVTLPTAKATQTSRDFISASSQFKMNSSLMVALIYIHLIRALLV